METAEKWTAGVFGGDCALHQQALGSVRMVCALGLRKLDYMHTIPYLFARLGEAGVNDLALRQFHSAPHSEHDPVTLKCLGPTSYLRPAVLALPSGGGPLPDVLEPHVRALSDIPFDDHVCEFPHAVAKKVLERSRAARWPWVASSLRLGQNLGSVQELAHATQADLQQVWNSWSSIINFKRPRRGVKMKRQAVLSQVYSLNTHKYFTCGGACEVVAGGEHFHDDLDVEHACVPPSDVAPPSPKEKPDAAGLDEATVQDRKLMAEFVQSIVHVYSYITVPTNDADEPWYCFQVLATQTKDLLVKTIASPEVDNVTWMIQPMSILNCGELPKDVAPASIVVFRVESQTHCSVFSVFGCDLAKRQRFMCWKEAVSPVDKCIRLIEPKRLAWTKLLSDAKIPVVCLLDELNSKGFVPAAHTVFHKKTCAQGV